MVQTMGIEKNFIVYMLKKVSLDCFVRRGETPQSVWRLGSFVHCTVLAGILAATFFLPDAIAQENGATQLEEIVIIGSRNQQPRSVGDSPVPVDVISGEEFGRLSNTADATDNLLKTVPSFNATTATGDSDSFSRPISLRGMAQDQILLLVNGKRRHRTSVIAEFAPAAGTGAQGPNIGMIPPIAAESIEVLRDGAAAQYGADAIAGVINFRLKDASHGGTTRLQYGKFYEGESSARLESNVGLPLGAKGFANFSIDYSDNDGLSRGFQRPDAQALIDQGVMGVGADSPFNDGLAQSWGRPETDNLLLFINSGYEISENSEAYLFGNYADTKGRFRFFYRPPDHPSRTRWLAERGYTGSVLETGYTPWLDGEQEDYSAVAGVRGRLPGDYSYDFSAAIGFNELDHYLRNAVSYAIDPQPDDIGKRSFYIGAYEQEEINLNADFTKQLNDSLHLAFGAEWREETWRQRQGEPDSYQGEYGGSFGTSPAGMQGFRPEDSGSWSRHNTALYTELEQDASDRLLLQYAVRYEDYSDFGNVLVGKVAARLDVTDTVLIRGSLSTGFHAPTPGQSNFQRETTTFDCPEAGGGFTGDCILGTARPDSAAAVAQGGSALEEEESVNFTVGASMDLGMFGNVTIDLYRIDVDDRIYKVTPPTGAYTDANGNVTQNISAATSYSAVSFFTNVLDVRSSGLDLVLTKDIHWNDSVQSNLTFAYNYNKFRVEGQDQINGHTLVSDAQVERIERSYPRHRFVAGIDTAFGDWDLLVRANYFGKHYDVDRGDITQGTSSPIDPVVFIDAELSYQFSDSLQFIAGGSNIFDEYVDRIDPDRYANRYGNGLPYPRRAAPNYEGGSWYIRTQYTF